MFPALEKESSFVITLQYGSQKKYITGPSEDVIHEGFLANASSSGLCLFTYNNFDIGAEIVLKKNIYIPFQRTKVKWTEEVNKNWYAIGLICKS